MKILATADLHLGRATATGNDQNEMLSATQVWQRIVTYAIEQNVDLLLLAGDIIDRDNRFYEAAGPLQQGFKKLGSANIPVYAIAGNHDFDTLPNLLESNTTGLEHVHLLGKGGKWELQNIKIGNKQVQIMGWSFPGQYVNQNPLLGASLPDIDDNVPAIGLLHGELNNPESRYAPLASAELQQVQGVNSWIVGHIHKPDLSEENSLILQPGSPQPLSRKETGLHGPWLLEFDGAFLKNATQVGLSEVRFDTLSINVDQIESAPDFRSKLLNEVERFTGHLVSEQPALHTIQLNIELTGHHKNPGIFDEWAGFADDYTTELDRSLDISIARVSNRIRPAVANMEELAGQKSPVGILARMLLCLEQGEHLPAGGRHLIENIQKEISRMNGNKVYLPLRNFGGQLPPDEESARGLLANECRKLIGELVFNQKEES